jgi:hypothetical protein
VGHTDVAGVLAVAAALSLRRPLEQQNLGAPVGGRHRCAQGGISATDHKDVDQLIRSDATFATCNTLSQANRIIVTESIAPVSGLFIGDD